MDITEATSIAVEYVRERFGYAKPTAGKPVGNKFLIETTHEILNDTPRLILEVAEDKEPKLVGSIGQYGVKHGRQVR